MTEQSQPPPQDDLEIPPPTNWVVEVEGVPHSLTPCIRFVKGDNGMFLQQGIINFTSKQMVWINVPVIEQPSKLVGPNGRPVLGLI